MSQKNPEVETPTEATQDKAALQRQAYGAATKRLREQHREEFNALMKEECAAAGIDWSPRPTEAEKAAQTLASLLEAHPELRSQV